MKKGKTALFFICVCIGYVYVRYAGTEKEYAQNVQMFMQVHAERIENTLNRNVEGGMILESLVRYLDFNFDKETFDYVASDWFDENTMISISYMPQGIVQWIYPPTKDNNNVLGLNVFEFEGTKKGALESKNNRSIMISGPLELQSGEIGLTVRTPIYSNNGVFWGFVSVLYNSESIAHEALEVKSIENLGYKYAIHSSYNGNILPLLTSEDFKYEKAFQIELNIAGNAWEFYLYSATADRESLLLFIQSFVEAIGLCAILLIGISILKKRQKQVYNQIYFDTLTKLYNRKKLDVFMANESEWKKRTFSIFYIDLNKFKPVNDMYGHAVGDKLLIAFAERLMHRFDEEATKIRMGGDEFALIIESELDTKSLKKVQQRIVLLAEEEFFIDQVVIQISASVGFATYPKDGPTLTEALEKADSMMYEEKQRKR